MLTRTLLIIAVSVATTAYAAQAYPNRTITLVVPSAPGGSLDLAARAVAQEMGKQMGQSLIVENKPGASGILAVQAVAQATPDGYTLLLTHSAPIINTPHLFSKVPYVVRRDLAFVSQIAMGRIALAVNDRVPVKDVQGLIAWATKNKDQMAYGSNGVGTFGHMTGTYLNQSRGLRMTHVPYKSEAQMVQDLSAGQVAWGTSSLGTLAPYVESGKVRLLAVFGDHRAKSLPNIPTMAEAGFPDAQFKSVTWVGMLAPIATPAPILARLEKEVRQAALSAPVQARFATFSSESIANSGADFRKDFEATEPMLKRLIESSGAKLD
ncbi:MAG: Bug family tripartite tricarboxylate transporter substrate binding protein [Cupriavidus necator]